LQTRFDPLQERKENQPIGFLFLSFFLGRWDLVSLKPEREETRQTRDDDWKGIERR